MLVTLDEPLPLLYYVVSSQSQPKEAHLMD